MRPTHAKLAVVQTRRYDDAGYDDTAAPVSVVVADDHEQMRRGLRQLLESEPSIVVAAEALDLDSTETVLAERQPDVLVLDLGIVDGSAPEVLGVLRGIAPRTQVVMVSVEDTPGIAQRALADGASGFVLKELADEDLAPAIRAAARGEEYLSPSIARRLAELRHALTAGRLTVRESEVLRKIALGHTNVEIARKLGVSPRTIETHRANVHAKLGLRTRAELVGYALRCGLLGT